MLEAGAVGELAEGHAGVDTAGDHEQVMAVPPSP
jgi:hypothetical protein